MKAAAPMVLWRAGLREDARVTGTEQHAALLLSTYWDGDGLEAYPSQPTLARQMKKSVKTVGRALAGIRALGIVTEVKRPGRTTVYHAVIPYPTPVPGVRGSVSTPLSLMTGAPDTTTGTPKTPGTDELAKEVVTQGAFEAESSLDEEDPEPAVIAERLLDDKPLMDWIHREGRHYLGSARDFRLELGRRFNFRGAVADEFRSLLLDGFEEAA